MSDLKMSDDNARNAGGPARAPDWEPASDARVR